MTDLLGGLSVGELSVNAILALVIFAFFAALIRGNLVPGKQVDRMIAERDERIRAQAEALSAAPKLALEQQAAITTLTESNRDFAEAARLQVRVAEAMHDNLTGGPG